MEVAPAWTCAGLTQGAAQTAGPSSGAQSTARSAARLASILSTASARLVQLVPMSAKHQIIREDAPRAQAGTSSWRMDATRQIDSRASKCARQQMPLESVQNVLMSKHQIVVESAPHVQPDARSALLAVTLRHAPSASLGTTSLEPLV